jgi:glycosyltransferase involved in cell wall biosynthesis
MSVRFDPRIEDFLKACSLQYDDLVDAAWQLNRRASAEGTLGFVEAVAYFAAMHHPGRFADGALESIVLDAGRDLRGSGRVPCASVHLTDTAFKATQRRRVLHVATMILDVGGLTRTILNWVRKDRTSQHSVVLTAHGDERILPLVPRAIAASGGQLVSLPTTMPALTRAYWLRCFAQEAADLVILHLHPYDVIPLAAFAEPGTPPVALVNLADQSFWIGSTVADAVIHQREVGAWTSRDLRFTRNDQLLPIPLCEPGSDVTRSQARTALGVPDDHVMLLSVGRSIKYAPSGRQSFFRTACAILDRHPQAHLHLVGVGAEDHAASPGFINHERMHFAGRIEEPTIYQRAADVYLEGFPFGSQTALLEAALAGLPCVLAPGLATPLLATQDLALTGIVDNPRDEEHYIARTSDLVRDRDHRRQLGDLLRQRVLGHHVDRSWNGYLDQIYSTLCSLSHTVTEIPVTTGASRPVDLAISEYHATRFTDPAPSLMVAGEARAFMLSAAYGLRQRGFYADAFRVLSVVNRRGGWDRASIGSVLKLVPHKITSLVGSVGSGGFGSALLGALRRIAPSLRRGGRSPIAGPAAQPPAGPPAAMG